jgi:nucleoredoxin
MVLSRIGIIIILALSLSWVAYGQVITSSESPSTTTSTTTASEIPGDLVCEEVVDNTKDEVASNVLPSGKPLPDDGNDGSLPSQSSESNSKSIPKVSIVQTGPLVDLLGPTILSLSIVNQSNAELRPHNTNDALRGKKVIGLYFSADWCGPCRKFTPELVAFYEKMNKRRGRKDEFEIVWISRCRDVNSYGQYFTHMGGWYALPPEEAMGSRGAKLGELYKVKGIPSLTLIDEYGNVITTDARNKIPQDKAGIGFPWRNPIATLYITVLPKSLRTLIKSQVTLVKESIISKVQLTLGLTKRNLNKSS